MKKTVSIIIALCLLLSGCATAHRLELDEGDSDRLLLVREMTADDHGRPVPGTYLKERPTNVGETYTAVQMRDGLPVSSFDIAIVEPREPDFTRPFAELGTSTAMGFFAGVVFGTSILLSETGSESSKSSRDDRGWNKWNLAGGSVVAGTAIGLVVGFVKSVSSLAEQMQLLVLKSDETLLGYSVYKYAAFRRLSLVMSHVPQGDFDLVVTTRFRYEDRSDIPVSSETYTDYFPMKDASGI